MLRKSTAVLTAAVAAAAAACGLYGLVGTHASAAAGSAGAEAFGDGGFEAPSLSAGDKGLRTLKAGQRLGRWEVTHDKVTLSEKWPAAEGRNSLVLDGCHGGIVAQTFSIEPGTYTLRFKLAADPRGDFGIKNLAVAADGDSDSYDFDSRVYRGRHIETVQDMAWQERTMPFETDGPTTTVEFAASSSSPGCKGPAIDDVRVVPNP